MLFGDTICNIGKTKSTNTISLFSCFIHLTGAGLTSERALSWQSVAVHSLQQETKLLQARRRGKKPQSLEAAG